MKRIHMIALAAALPLVGGGCQLARDARSAAVAPAGATCPRLAGARPAVAAAGGWEVDEGSFSFRVPRGFDQLDVAPDGRDARVALFDSANGRVTLLSELASGERPAAASSGSTRAVARCREVIGGRAATLTVFRIDSAGHPEQRLRHGRYVAEATWRDPVIPGQYLTLRGEGADADALRVVFAAMRSVRFEGGRVAKR
ncbi:MAG TPA: hypothetical protein VKA84_01260 [Gemmatimonadaceae bacterium]|nr:hypothetical protein [Gemmatimonadaceae bacterium]